MSSRRALKAAQAIREVVSTAILLQLKDPRVKDVTVTMVEVSGDLRAAKIYVSVMGDKTKQELCLKGLRSSVGFLQKKVGNRIDTRYTPRLTFVLDKGARNAMEVTRILKEVLPQQSAAQPDVDGTENPDQDQSLNLRDPDLDSRPMMDSGAVPTSDMLPPDSLASNSAQSNSPGNQE